jgi:hypothetical protein
MDITKAPSLRSHFVLCPCPAAVAAVFAVCVAVLCFAPAKPSDAQSASIWPPSSQQAPPQPAPSSASQALPASATAKPDDLAKEALVFEKLSTRVREEADGTGTQQVTARIRIQSVAGVKAMAVLTFAYTESNQKIDVAYVRVIKPDGSVVATPPYNIQDMPADVSREAPMYSDIHQKHVAVKGLGVGDTLEYQVTLTTFRPEVPGQFWFEYSFEKEMIALDELLDIDLPAEETVTVVSADVQPTVTTSGGRKLYHWAGSNLARPDPDAPPRSEKNWRPTIQVTTFTTWEQVGEWYSSLEKDSLTITPAIQARADALTKGLTPEQDKLRAIFDDVALHIHYVGLDFGIGRYQPHPADDVLSNEYGDCKDKHTLLATLLKAAGIEAWPVLISTKHYLDPATPSPAQFDHVITVVPINGKLLWMDSTEEVAPIGVLAGVLRDKQALAIPVGKPAYLVRTPADLPSPRTVRAEIQGSLSGQGLFTGRIAETLDGDAGAVLRSAFRRVSQSQWKDLIERIARSQTYGGEVSNPQVSDVEKINEPFHFSFDYRREQYYKWDDSNSSHWIGPPMPPMGGELPPGIKEKKPADDPELGATGETIYRSSMQLPLGWSMDLPKNVDIVQDWAEYHAKYTFAAGVFTAERRVLIKKTTVPLSQWYEYLVFRRELDEDWSKQALIWPPKTNGRHP